MKLLGYTILILLLVALAHQIYTTRPKTKPAAIAESSEQEP